MIRVVSLSTMDLSTHSLSVFLIFFGIYLHGLVKLGKARSPPYLSSAKPPKIKKNGLPKYISRNTSYFQV